MVKLSSSVYFFVLSKTILCFVLFTSTTGEALVECISINLSQIGSDLNFFRVRIRWSQQHERYMQVCNTSVRMLRPLAVYNTCTAAAMFLI